MNDGRPQHWSDAIFAANLLAVDPVSLGGAALLAGPGHARDAWLGYLRGLLPEKTPFRRVPAGIEDDRLLGGIDLPATLETRSIVAQRGVLAEADGGFVILAMAERLTPGTAARIAEAMDTHAVRVEREGLAQLLPTRFAVIALDEHEPEEAGPPRKLLQRLAFPIDLRDVRTADLDSDYPVASESDISEARLRLSSVEAGDDTIVEALVAVAVRFGIDEVTAPLLALRAARAAAAFGGRLRIAEEDASIAVRLVLAPRATRLPEESVDEPEPAPPSEPPPESSDDPRTIPAADDLTELLVEAARAWLPAGLLQAHEGNAPRGSAVPRSGGGRLQKQAKRGRRIGVRCGDGKNTANLALVATLRTAAPWQTMRRATAGHARTSRIEVRRDDFRLHRFAERRESVIIFAVDASGSAAFHRLSEAKGAVLLLLGEAYAQRTSACLIVFRAARAELLLPPTRSLARAKTLLASLPGGGGTPLACGIALAQQLAESERRKGRDPTIVILSDGRANITLDGHPGRETALSQAQTAARACASAKLRCLFIDTSPRPGEEAALLASAMGARYLPLPYLQAETVRAAVRDVL